MDPALCEALSALERDGPLSSFEALVAQTDQLTLIEAFQAFFLEGWHHVLPSGLDHLLFVAAICLSTRNLVSLAKQISVFTLAHTAAVGLSAAGWVSPPSSIIEPLIAASIVIVALEAAVYRTPPSWRLAVIFGFGLIHGMGFAGAFSAATTDGVLFWPGLIGFNLGVEAGQIVVGGSVFAAAWAIRRLVFSGDDGGLYRRAFTWPILGMIGLFGVWWTLSALGLTGG